MKNQDFLDIDQRIELHVATDRGILNLATHIEHIPNQDNLIVAAPVYQGRMYPFLSREHVKLLSVVEDVGVVSCDAVVSKRLINGGSVFLSLERISNFKKKQRRKHYRLPTLLDARMTMKDSSEKEKEGATVVSKDISAGGMRCITPFKFNPSEEVSIQVSLNGEALELKSNVVDCQPLDNVFETRLSFGHLKKRQEHTILAYIFEEKKKRNIY